MYSGSTILKPAVATIFLWLAIAVLFPFCQYYIDPDAVAYLTVAKRYSEGDWHRAINGYWSPLSCWLTAIGIRAGMEAFTAAILVNSIGATGFLWASSRLIRKFNILPVLSWVLHSVLVIFLSSAVYFQSFADLWQCFLLLTSLLILLSDSFFKRIGWWFLYGIIGALAYFAKAYSLSFFILNTVVCGIIIVRGWQKEHLSRYLAMVSVSLATMLLFSFPWIYLLHEKYGLWMSSTAGKLNLSWYLLGEPIFKEEYRFFLPPPYPDSPYYWEDPYFVNGITPHFYTSLHFFKMQLVRIGYNLMKLIDSLNLLSPLTYPAWILALLIAVPTKVRNYFPEKLQIPAVSMLIFPLGFLLINFEPRYIWYTYPIILVIAALGVQKLLPLIERPILRWMVLFLFGLSFVTGPVWQLKPLIHTGKEEFQLAAAWKEAGIIGSFTTNGTDGKSHQKAARLAYFSGNPYFLIPANQLDTKSEMHQEIERYHIRYFVYLPDGNHEIGTFSLLDKNGLPYPLVWQGRGGIKVYQLFSTEN